MDKESRYFQAIARIFFELRGAPFILSSREFSVIEGWKNQRIPLGVVLEGIKRTFSEREKTAGRRRMSLLYCERYVQEAFCLHKERKIGWKSAALSSEEKGRRIRDEIDRFLKEISPRVYSLRPHFQQACVIIQTGVNLEEELEDLEEKIDHLILRAASDKEKKLIREKTMAEYRLKERDEFERVFKIRLQKFMRDRYHIPYISPFYY